MARRFGHRLRIVENGGAADRRSVHENFARTLVADGPADQTAVIANAGAVADGSTAMSTNDDGVVS
jgi:hypothetical protein